MKTKFKKWKITWWLIIVTLLIILSLIAIIDYGWILGYIIGLFLAILISIINFYLINLVLSRQKGKLLFILKYTIHFIFLALILFFIFFLNNKLGTGENKLWKVTLRPINVFSFIFSYNLGLSYNFIILKKHRENLTYYHG